MTSPASFAPDRHQLRAVDRMLRGSTLLVWDPGVGKTWPCIAAAESTPGHTLAIVPAHLRQQWHDKVIEHSTLVPIILEKTTEPARLDRGDFFICSYEYASQVPRWRELRGHKWTNLILDEAHYLARQSATRTQAILGPRATSAGALYRAAGAVWLLTGTPFTFPDEIYPILSRIFPKAIQRPDGTGPMNRREWENRFCVVEQTNFGEKIVAAQNVPELRERLAPFLDKVRLSEVHPWGNAVDTVTITGDLTKLTTGLDPALLDQYQAISEILADDEIPDDEKLAELEICGLDMAQLRHNIALAKVRATAEMVAFELETTPGKIVVYGWHREPMRALAQALKAPIIQGGTTDKGRREAVERFVNDPRCRVLCGQISAIGTGTDGLQQAAHRGIFMEQSWRFLENKQAMHRLYRRGQKKDTYHTFLSLHGTVDEYVARVMRRKAENVRRALD